MAIYQLSQRVIKSIVIVLSVSAVVVSGACQPASPTSSLPAQVIVWEDPETGGQGSSVRDANNDAEGIVLVGANGLVQFVTDGSVCNDCNATGATIDLGEGNLIDIRFGVGAVGDTDRRAFMVDRTSGNFVQIVGGRTEDVTFQVTSEPFEEPNDRSDDMAIVAGEVANPTLQGSSSSGSTGLCGALGGIIPVFGLGLLLVCLVRRR